jgi:hypothetical protein
LTFNVERYCYELNSIHLTGARLSTDI